HRTRDNPTQRPRHTLDLGQTRPTHPTPTPTLRLLPLRNSALSAEIVLRSPDLRHTLQFDPQSATSAWWRLRAEPAGSEPGWFAEFGELVPAEVLAGITDALVAPARAEPSSPLSVLEGAGWLIDGRGSAASDPPGCTVERRPESGRGTVPWREPERVSWHIEVHDQPEVFVNGPRLWHAWFDGHTPEHLVTACVAALADPAPLQRGMFDRTGHGAAQSAVLSHRNRSSMPTPTAWRRLGRRPGPPAGVKAPRSPPGPPQRPRCVAGDRPERKARHDHPPHPLGP
ncbi:DUF317 domain-containing protein, partial [Streptomyces sp. H39-C1]|uniref:DUF317 domain-containing protein n=1 Tax=Streptomyces sp. H39-C1 TaxID=3004355 RepID=UPI0022AF16EF